MKNVETGCASGHHPQLDKLIRGRYVGAWGGWDGLIRRDHGLFPKDEEKEENTENTKDEVQGLFASSFETYTMDGFVFSGFMI